MADADFEEQEKRLRERLKAQSDAMIKLRSKDREFHGLEREFYYHQAQMLADYERSKDIKHPRDVGTVREQILRKFLTSSGYLPKRYAVSERSVRVASTSGHLSNEIDIALYDPSDSVTLMNREDVYEVHPVESVYGVIQVKSRVSKADIRGGLKNLASFKKLDRTKTRHGVNFTAGDVESRGFGLLFAFDSDLEWTEIIREIEKFANTHPKRNWANAIFILNRGFFLHGGEGFTAFANTKIEGIETLQMYGFPDRQNQCLFQFQSMLLNLLRHTAVAPAELDPYFQLPLIAEDQSYSFAYGAFAELGKCDAHGEFARKIAPDALKRLVDWCRDAEPINWIRAMNKAYGLPEDEAAYARQPGDVLIYNPEGLSLTDVLTRDGAFGEHKTRVNAFDHIQTRGMNIWVPYYYTAKEGLISDCPTCFPPPKKPRARRKPPA